MIEINVSRKGDVYCIEEALRAVPYREPAILRLGEGVFHQKIYCDKKDIKFIGDHMDKTVITWSDGAAQPQKHNEEKMGTFRTYTAFFGGERVEVENMTIINAVSQVMRGGQALAAYVDAEVAVFRNVRFLGHQDTLFCAPLPDKENVAKGFSGPRELAPRMANKQYYVDCVIQGDVDFIFGGADAVFERCEIISNDRKSELNGYVTAPSGKKDGLGLVFKDCKFTSDAAPGTVMLGRPWRPEGKTALINCELGAHIHPLGWNKWNSPEEIVCTFAEYGCTGAGADRSGREPWSLELDDKAAAELEARVAQHIKDCLG